MRLAILASAMAVCFFAKSALAQIDIQEKFDPLGPDVRVFTLQSGKQVGFVDEGPRDGTPVVFIGGAGTSAYAYALTGFLRTMSEDLGLRFIAVERDGFGVTALTEGFTYDDYAGEVGEILASLNVEAFSLLAISGGGPYAAAVAGKYAERVKSLHLLAAFSQYDPKNPDTSGLCGLEAEKIKGAAAYYAANPAAWWDLGENSPTHKIPGFSTMAQNDGARTFTMRGQASDGAALLAEFNRFCTAPVVKGDALKAPVFIYEGADDTTVKSVHGDFWESNYSNIAARRTYPDVGHSVQYRHWDQVLLDLAGMSEKSIVCLDGKSTLLDADAASAKVSEGHTRGICAWAK